MPEREIHQRVRDQISEILARVDTAQAEPPAVEPLKRAQRCVEALEVGMALLTSLIESAEMRPEARETLREHLAHIRVHLCVAEDEE